MYKLASIHHLNCNRVFLYLNINYVGKLLSFSMEGHPTRNFISKNKMENYKNNQNTRVTSEESDLSRAYHRSVPHHLLQALCDLSHHQSTHIPNNSLR